MGIGRDQSVVFGNDFNDLGMFRWAARSFALRGSHAAVIAAASDVTRETAEADGVAITLEALLRVGRGGGGPGELQRARL